MRTKKLLATLVIVSIVIFAGCKKDDHVETKGVCPIVVSTVPTNGATGIPINQVITVTFNERVNPATITQTSFTLQGLSKVSGTLTYDGSGPTFSFAPSVPLLYNTTYTGRVATSVKDNAGNALQKEYVWTFTTIAQYTVVLSANPMAGGTTTGGGTFDNGTSISTGATANSGYTFTNWTEGVNVVSSNANYTFILTGNRTLVANFKEEAVGPGAVNLGSAADFEILTKAGISTTGVTSITGDIGVSPAAAASITGFGLIMDASNESSHTPIVIGKVYAADYAAPTPAKMTIAVSDMETAYTTANGLTVPAPVVELGAGNISGMNLAPGLYKWSTGLLISGSGVTLTGTADDTWVFQITQNLTAENSVIITLAGGAQAKNIFWVVAGQAILGTMVNFSGNILSKTLISLNDGTIITGRLLAQTAITLIGSTVIKP